jgi:methionine sulfoxide reductase heme-binding subunit
MNKPTLITLKLLTWLACLAPITILAWDAIHNNLGPDPTAAIEHSTGFAALRILILSLAITPLRLLWSRLSWLIQFRRLLGLFAFFYASIHLFAYLGLYAAFDPHTITQDILKRSFIWAGVLAWLLMVPLALTSTTASIKRLGGKRWQRLHMLVYASAILAIAHYWWQVKTGVLSPMDDTLVLTGLFIARPILTWWKSRRNAGGAA